nr:MULTISPECIES: tetratricopeptide repeat protein [unclassified Schaalia]
MDQLRNVAEQLGVTAQVAVKPEDTQEPIPTEHIPAREAQEAGDLENARKAWEKVIELNPRDEVAKTELAKVLLLLRSRENTATDDPQSQADALFAAGQHEEAFDILLHALRDACDDETRDAVRTHALDLFRVAGNTPQVRAARRRLTTLLMV